jgi:hypothetical protein
MTTGVQVSNQQSSSSYFKEAFRAVKNEAKSVVQSAAHAAFSAMEFTAETLFDWGRGTDYTCQWVKDYSNCSSDVKDAAGKVKGVADRFNLVASFSEMVVSGRGLVRGSMDSIGAVVESVSAHAGATADFVGRLGGLGLLKLGAAGPYFEGVDAIATTTLAVKGTRDAVLATETSSSTVSSMIKIAKNVTLLGLGALCVISACFASIAATIPQLPLFILTAATVYLGLKVVDCFYDKLALPSPMQLASRMV